jgi:dCMP deaminase
MKTKMKLAHMRAAYAYSLTSHCVRRKVGCVIVSDQQDGNDTVVSIGYNGTPAGEDNVCEIPETGLTKPNVIHAEENALRKLKNNANGLHLFCTTSPCDNCAKLILTSGVTHVYYKDLYRTTDGIEFLIENGIIVEHVPLTE